MQKPSGIIFDCVFWCFFLLNLSSPRVLHMKSNLISQIHLFQLPGVQFQLPFCRSCAYIVTKSQDRDSMLDQQLLIRWWGSWAWLTVQHVRRRITSRHAFFSLKNWCPDLQTYKSVDDSETNQLKLSQCFLEAAQEQYCLCAIARIDLWGHSFREMSQQELHVLWHLISISGFA